MSAPDPRRAGRDAMPELDRLFAEARGAEPPPELGDVYDALQSRLRAEEGRPGPRLRALPTPLRRAVVALIAATMLLVTALAVPRPDLGSLPLERHLAVLGSAGLLLIVAMWGALRPLQLPSARRWAAGATAALAVTAVGGLALLAPTGASPRTAHLVCFLGGLAMSLPVLVAARLLDRGTRAGPLLAATAAGLAGYLALHLHCGIDERFHLIFGHATVVVGAVSVGALSLLMRPRPR